MSQWSHGREIFTVSPNYTDGSCMKYFCSCANHKRGTLRHFDIVFDKPNVFNSLLIKETEVSL